MITMKDFTFKYEHAKKITLNNINLEIAEGDFVGIIGESGAGKTTFTRAINGIIPHFYDGDFYGSVLVDGIDTVESSTQELSKFIGSVFQDIDSQIISMSVEDEMMFGLENFSVPHDEIEQRISESLEAVGISNIRHRDIKKLSGGQKQKVIIAAILALRPRIIVLDEPTGELDPQSSLQVFQALKLLNEKYSITIVVVEQKIMQLSAFCKKLIVLEKGSVVFYDEVRKVLENAHQLENLGVNVPRIVSLCELLRQAKIYNGITPTNIKEATKMVEEALK